jgi:hexosaminidase
MVTYKGKRKKNGGENGGKIPAGMSRYLRFCFLFISRNFIRDLPIPSSMKKILLPVIITLFSCAVVAQASYPVIPYPNQLLRSDGVFEFRGELTVSHDRFFDTTMATMVPIFRDEYLVRLLPSKSGRLTLRHTASMPAEAYRLIVDKDRILVEASTSAGCFYGLQTLRQLMRLTGKGSYQVPACRIEDRPAFSWRAYMLDEARNFQGKKLVKTLLDQMALLKMNTFHWHLTDDQGWRIEIKKYPLLTDVGAWRDSTRNRRSMFVDGKWRWVNDVKWDASAKGGYYTQADIREIVSYAAARHIRIVPEIEMPGHAMAAMAAYPWLLASGEQLKVPTDFGIKDYAYHVADPRVQRFLEDVLQEVIGLFPGKVIHIGGDEVRYDSWRNSPAVKSLMEKEKLVTYADLQVHFTNRISGFLEKKGYRMMGWNEIMGNVHLAQEPLRQDSSGIPHRDNVQDATTRLANGTIIHFWKGDPALLIRALEKGYDVVNSTNTLTYLDYPIARTSLSTAYHFSPVPPGSWKEKGGRVLGLGCQMWGEVTPRVTDVLQYTFPRIAAYAEVGWTLDENKDFARFSSYLQELKRYWDKAGISYLD